MLENTEGALNWTFQRNWQQEEDTTKQKNTTQYMLNTIIRKQTQIT